MIGTASYNQNMEIANFLDHTLLRPDATTIEVERLCIEAKHYGLKAVCIPPYHVGKAAHILEDSKTKIATVIGFPMGYSSVPSKVSEINWGISHGANEFDVVLNVCAVKNGDWNYIRNEIDSVTTAAQLRGKVLKLILETGLLNKSEIERICTICRSCGVDYVKNSTGFNSQGASIETVQFLKELLESQVKVKAAGGIRTSSFARALIEAGANRIGSSTCLQLL